MFSKHTLSLAGVEMVAVFRDADDEHRPLPVVSGETHLSREAVSLLIQVNPDGGGDDDGRRGQSEAVRIALLKERVICGTADDKQSLVAQSFRWEPLSARPSRHRSSLRTRSCWMVGSLITWAAGGWFALDVDSKSPFFALVHGMGVFS